MRADGAFTIIQLTDLHLADMGETDRRTEALLGELLDAERPDLAVLTGDMLTAAECADPARALGAALRPLEARGVRFTAVLGNHDDEGMLPRRAVFRALARSPLFLGEEGPEALEGVGHHALDVLGAGDDRPRARLVCLDSLSYDPLDRGAYASVTPPQVAWAEALAREVRPAPALVFLHIPIPAYALVWERGGCLGTRLEPVCCPREDGGLHRVLAEAGNVVAMFAGHDHVNDYEGTLDGVRLCYGRHSGYGGYGRDDFPRGARLVRLREEGASTALETWIRLAGGAVEPRVLLQPEA